MFDEESEEIDGKEIETVKKKNTFRMESPNFYRKIKVKEIMSLVNRDRSSSAHRKDLQKAKQKLHNVLINADFNLL